MHHVETQEEISHGSNMTGTLILGFSFLTCYRMHCCYLNYQTMIHATVHPSSVYVCVCLHEHAHMSMYVYTCVYACVHTIYINAGCKYFFLMWDQICKTYRTVRGFFCPISQLPNNDMRTFSQLQKLNLQLRLFTNQPL